MTKVVDQVLASEGDVDPQLFDEIRRTPGFAKALELHLKKRPEGLGGSRAAGHLLSIAFADQKHLIWTTFRRLSADALLVALQSKELSKAESISLCIDTMEATPDQLTSILSDASPETLRDFYFHQTPTRTSDDASTNLFLQISSRQPPRLLLRGGRIMVSGAFSASLRHRFWLPTSATDFVPPFQVFPVQHMFVRRSGSGRYYYFGDAIIGPERFAAGFFNFLRHIAKLRLHAGDLALFASAAPSFQEMLMADQSEYNRVEISPILPEHRSIPLAPVRKPIQACPVTCWPKVRDLPAGSWTVLVAVEDYHEGAPMHTPLVKYAFVRSRINIPCQNLPGTATHEEYLDIVGGFKEFLQATATSSQSLDIDLVDRCIQEILHARSRGKDADKQPPAGRQWTEVFEPADAWEELKDFLDDATTYGRKTLQLAMEERPEGKSCRQVPRPGSHLHINEYTARKWYPELVGAKDAETMREFAESGYVK
jgi:hypothetical protein